MSTPGNKPILHFAHANSYPAGTYRVFFQYLRQNYEVQALDMHAHNPKYPVTYGWHALVQELIEDLIARYNEPVVLVGHSLGGMLSMMAAKARPDHLGALRRRPFPVSIGFVGGSHADECRQAGLAATRRTVGKYFRIIPGGHLFPMESPALAAQATHEMIESLLLSR